MSQDQVHPITFDDLQSAILPLFAIASDANWHPLGTAFVVAVPEPKNALLLTSAHNIIPILNIDGQYNKCHSTTPNIFRSRVKSVDLRRANIHPVLKYNETYIVIDMIKAWVKQDLDVAAILISIPSSIDAEFQSKITIDTSPIEVGTPVMAVGYSEMKTEFMEPPDYEAMILKTGFQFRIEYRTGKVLEICPKGMGIHKWPGFLVDFAFDSGMSGGPVIDLSSPIPAVRGLIGGDISEAPEQQQRGSGLQAFTTMIWLAMIIKTEITFLKDEQQLVKNAELLDMAKHGIIHDLGFAQNHIRRTEISPGFFNYWWDN